MLVVNVDQLLKWALNYCWAHSSSFHLPSQKRWPPRLVDLLEKTPVECKPFRPFRSIYASSHILTICIICIICYHLHHLPISFIESFTSWSHGGRPLPGAVEAQQVAEQHIQSTSFGLQMSCLMNFVGVIWCYMVLYCYTIQTYAIYWGHLSESPTDWSIGDGIRKP